MTERWYSISSAAEILDWSPKKIRRAARDGEFPNARKVSGRGGAEWRIPKRDLDAWMDENTVETESPDTA